MTSNQPSVQKRIPRALSWVAAAAKQDRKVTKWLDAFSENDTQQALTALAEMQEELLNIQHDAYSTNTDMLIVLEGILVAAMAHSDDHIRSTAIVLLNVLYDGHDLQLSDPLTVTIATVGETCSVTIPLLPAIVHSSPAELPEPKGRLSLRLFVPSPQNRIVNSETLSVLHDSVRAVVSCQLPPFKTTGFYDFVLESTDPSDLEEIDLRRTRGRFIVHPEGLRDAQIIEVPVDEVGATWNENTGDLHTRGNFDNVLKKIPDFKLDGASAVYLMGALQRPAEDDELSAQPFVVADRSAPATILGGENAFKKLIDEIRRVGMTPIVDAIDRVSKTRAHRRYRPFMVSSIHDGVQMPHPGTDGVENEWDATALLNYRHLDMWEDSIAEIENLIAKFGIKGVRLDNGQSAPVTMRIDDKEMYRKDIDDQFYYSPQERFFGTIVARKEASGYWDSEAALYCGYPNPFLVKFARTLWSTVPDFVLMAEAHFNREALLATSGFIPHSVRVPQILASINGKSLQRDGTVARLPDNKRSTAQTMSRLFKNDLVSMPKNAVTIGCTCSHLSPYPPALFGRRSWISVDLLFLTPNVPMLLYGEMKGTGYRRNVVPALESEEHSSYNVNFDEFLPRSPKRKGRSSPSLNLAGISPILPGRVDIKLQQVELPTNVASQQPLTTEFNTCTLSLMQPVPVQETNGLPRVKRAASSASLESFPGFPLEKIAPLPGDKYITTPRRQGRLRAKRSVRSSGINGQIPSGRGEQMQRPPTPKSPGMIRSKSKDDMRALSIRSMSVDDLKKISQLEAATREEIGDDIKGIIGHYTHRRLIRQEHPGFRRGRICMLHPDPQVKEQLFSFACFTDTDVYIVALNMKFERDGSQYSGTCSADIDLRVLWEVLGSSFTEHFNDLYKFVDVFTGDDYWPNELFTLEELVFCKLAVHLPPLGTLVLKLEHVASPPEKANGPSTALASSETQAGEAPIHSDTGVQEKLYDRHYAQCLRRLQEEDASIRIKDARENFVISTVARAAASSLHEFSIAINRVRAGLSQEGCDEGTISSILQLTLQRASALLPHVLYEIAVPPKDFEPPIGERIASYLSMLSTVATDGDVLFWARRLVKSATKIGPLVFLTAELGRFSTAGGLGVMVDELTKGMASLGLEVYVVSPYYAVNRKNQTNYLGKGFMHTRNMLINVGSALLEVGVFEGIENGVNLIFLERKDYFTRVYEDAGSAVHHLQTIMLLSLGALEVFCQKKITPGMVITNDWLPSLASGYARNGHFGSYFDESSFFHLIHNLGDMSYEGRVFPEKEGDDMGYIHKLPRHLLVDPWWSRVVVNPTRCALMCSDSWGTVSPGYLGELLAGHPLSALLQLARAPFAYPNGIRQADREKLLKETGAENHVNAKGILQKRYFGFENGDPSIPLLAFVGRITSQKGVHLILNAVEELIGYTEGRIQILVGGPAKYSDQYGSGCASHMEYLRSRHKFCFWASPWDFFVDGPLVNLGADFGLMPSYFEPGGIVQQEFFVAGTPVIAHKTGGLRDTVHEWNSGLSEGNGFLFEEYNHGNFVSAVKRALHVFSNPIEYQALRQAAYSTTIDVSQVAWAWSSEFHRIRNAIYTREEVRRSDYKMRIHTELDTAIASGVVASTARAVRISWPDGSAKSVTVVGSWDNWAAEHRLIVANDSEGELETELILQEGHYTYKYRVDGTWMLAANQPRRVDDGGNENNYLIVE